MANLHLLRPARNLTSLRPIQTDALVRPDALVRQVWTLIERFDAPDLYKDIRVIEGEAGRPAIDPKLILAIWIYGTIEGIASARRLARLCERDLDFIWLCGGVPVSHDVLSAFRRTRAAELEDLMARHIHGLIDAGIVDLDTVLQDGVRVRASAGSSSFRRRAKLEQRLDEIKLLLKELRKGVDDDDTPPRPKRQQRSLEEQQKRIERALEAVAEIEKARAAGGTHKSKAEQEQSRRKVATGEVRASTTDPDARRMKMADGGVRPAYSIQLATSKNGRFCLGVLTLLTGVDAGQFVPMIERLKSLYNQPVNRIVVDGGFVSKSAIEAAYQMKCSVFAPPQKPTGNRDPYTPLPKDKPGVAAWRQRMGTDDGKATYALRSTVELQFARMRNQGLTRFLVRGKERVHFVAVLHAFTQNIVQDYSLARETAALAREAASRKAA